MKIGFVLDDTLDSTDGVQQYVLTLGTWLSSQGHDVHYLVGHTTRNDIEHVHSLSRNVKVRFNGNRMSMPLPVRRRAVRALLAREQFDVLHVQVPYSPFMAGVVIRSAPASTGIVGTFHIAPHSGMVRAANWLLARWVRSSLRRFDGMLSVSSAARAFALDTYRLRTVVMPNVVDAKCFAHSSAFPFPGDDIPVILFLGRLVPRKGCMVLLQAVHRMREQQPSQVFRVVICGRGPLEAELRAYSKANGLDDVVYFMGYVNEEDKRRCLRAADLAVFPSSGGESFGIVLIEAMAAEHPVVLAADNPGYASVMSGQPDSMFPVGDADELSDKMHSYLTDQDRRAKALAWQQANLPQYDVAVVGAQLVGIYNIAATAHGHP